MGIIFTIVLRDEKRSLCYFLIKIYISLRASIVVVFGFIGTEASVGLGGCLGYERNSAVAAHLPRVTDLFALVVSYGDIRGLIFLGGDLNSRWFLYYDALIGEVDLS